MRDLRCPTSSFFGSSGLAWYAPGDLLAAAKVPSMPVMGAETYS